MMPKVGLEVTKGELDRLVWLTSNSICTLSCWDDVSPDTSGPGVVTSQWVEGNNAEPPCGQDSNAEPPCGQDSNAEPPCVQANKRARLLSVIKEQPRFAPVSVIFTGAPSDMVSASIEIFNIYPESIICTIRSTLKHRLTAEKVRLNPSEHGFIKGIYSLFCYLFNHHILQIIVLSYFTLVTVKMDDTLYQNFHHKIVVEPMVEGKLCVRTSHHEFCLLFDWRNIM